MQNSLWGRRRRLLTTSVICLVRVTQWCQGELFYSPRLEHRIWRIQRGSKPLVHMSMVTEYSLSWLSQVREGIALFIVIYNLVRSWLCGPGAEGDGMLFVQNSLWAHELSSAGRTRVGSPDVLGPAHLHGVGVRVDLKGGEGGAQRRSCVFTGCWRRAK